MKLRLLLAGLIDEFGDAIQFFFALGDQSFQARAVIEQARFGLLVHKIDDLRQDRLGRMKKLGVIARDPLVPVSVRLPFSAVGGGPKDVALARQDEIGMDRELEIGQARFEQIDGPAGIDRPDDAVLLQLLDVFHAAAIEHRIAAVRDEGAVEIGAEKTDFARTLRTVT